MDHDELQTAYAYINNELFRRIIQLEYRDTIVTIDHYQLIGAIPKGENFASVIIRAIVHFTFDDDESQLCEKRFIIKAAHSNEKIRTEVSKFRIFEKEIQCYSEVIPEVQRLLYQIGDHTKLAPKCYEVNLKDSYLVFEDLSDLGYRQMSKKISLDIDHYQLVMNKLSKWHAATAIMGSKNISQFADFLIHPMNFSATWKNMISNTMRACAKLTETLPGYEALSAKLLNSIDTMYGKVRKSVERRDASFTVLCHGDIWSNNMMFSYDINDKPIDVIFLDFQTGYWGPAVLDIANTLFTSSNENVREEDWKQLMHQYSDELSIMLERLDYIKDIPTIEEITDEFLRRSTCSCYMGLVSVGTRCWPPAGDTDTDDSYAAIFFDATEKYDAIRLEQFSHHTIRKSLIFLLNYFDRNGYFD